MRSEILDDTEAQMSGGIWFQAVGAKKVRDCWVFVRRRKVGNRFPWALVL